MKSKYSEKIKESATFIASAINTPVSNKKILFLFGAGMNFNLAKNASNWDDLALNSLTNYFAAKNSSKKEVKKNVYKILDKYSKKIALSISKEYISLDIKPLPYEKIKWFIDGYNLIMKKTKNNVGILTLNYDDVIDKILHRSGSTLNDWRAHKASETVIHIHGKVNAEGFIEKEAMVSLPDYVNGTPIVEERLVKYLENELFSKKHSYDTLVIIGTSLEDEHIMRAVQTFKDHETKKIVMITRYDNTNEFFDELCSIYDKLNITLFNIYAGRTYEEDFKAFWECLADTVNNKAYSGELHKIIGRDDIDTIELYKTIKTWAGDQQRDLTSLLKHLGIECKADARFFDSIYRLEKVDKLLKKGSLKMFMLKEANASILSHLHKLTDEKLNKEDIEKILNVVNGEVKNIYIPLSGNTWKYTVQEFLKNNLKILTKHNFSKRKKLLGSLAWEVLSDTRVLDKDIEKFILSKFSFTEIFSLGISRVRLSASLGEDSAIYKFFKNDFDKNKYPIKGFSPPTNIGDFLKKLYKSVDTYKVQWLLTLFLFPKYKEFIANNLYDLIELFNSKNQHNKFNPKLHFAFRIIYFVMIRHENKEKYLKLIKRDDDKFSSRYKEFPSMLHLFGYNNPMTEKLSQYDGKPINAFEPLQSWKDVERILNKEIMMQSEADLILNYVKLNWNKKMFKKILYEKRFNDIWSLTHNGQVVIKCKKLSEYKDYYFIIKESGASLLNRLLFLRIEPPFSIFDRINNIERSLKNKYNQKEMNEISMIIEIQMLKGEYSDQAIWFNREIQIALQYYEKNKNVHNIINKLFKDLFDWDSKHWTSLIKGKIDFKTIDEWYITLLCFKQYKPVPAQEIIEMKMEKKIVNQPHETAMFLSWLDYNIRQFDHESWNQHYKNIIKYLGKLIKDEGEKTSGDLKEIRDSFYARIVYNKIFFNDTKKDRDIQPYVSYITNAIIQLEKPKDKDKTISTILDFSIMEENFQGTILAIRRLDSSTLGDKTKEWFGNKIIEYLKMLDKYTYIYHMKPLKTWVKNLKQKQAGKIDKIIKERHIRGAE